MKFLPSTCASGDHDRGFTAIRYEKFDLCSSKKQCVPTELTATRGLIQGEVHDPKAFILGEHCGSAGLFSNLADLIKFAKWMLAPQTIPGILAPETVVMLYADHTPTHDLGRSLGWNLRYDQSNTPCLYHTGFTGTFMLLDQKREKCLDRFNKPRASKGR